MQALAQLYRVIAEAGHISNLENSGFATSCVAGVPGCESLVKPVEIPAMEYATAGDVRVQPGGGTGWGHHGFVANRTLASQSCARWRVTNFSTLIGLSAQPLDEVLSLPPNGSIPFPVL
jgi:hypothetical protein